MSRHPGRTRRMHVGMVGINHKLAHLRVRELLANVCQKRFGAGSSTHGEHHFILLSTCNRTELYFHSLDLTATHAYLLKILRSEVSEEFDQKLYSFFGHDCFLHLCRVTAGLDSAIVAETEIQGQVKASYELSTSYQTIPFALHFLFQKALRVGKQVRSLFLKEGRGMPGLEDSIYSEGLKTFGVLQGVRALFVGASEINQKLMHFLKRRGLQDITLCNRTLSRAESCAEVYQAQVLPWQELAACTDYDWVIFGTKATEILLRREMFHSNAKPLLILDLCVPRNVHPHVGQLNGVSLKNIDHLNHVLQIRQQQMYHALLVAEAFIREAAQKYVSAFISKGAWQPHLELITA